MLNKKNSGQTIVELLVALGIATVVIVALVGASVGSLSNANFAKTQGEATRVSREAMEWLRGQRDQDWNSFASRSGNTWCLQTLGFPLRAGACSASQVIPGTILIREATLTSTADNTLEALVLVYWADSRGRHEVRLNSRLTRWR